METPGKNWLMLSEVFGFPPFVFRSVQCWPPLFVAASNASCDPQIPPSFPTNIASVFGPAPLAKLKACTSTCVEVLFPLPSAEKSAQELPPSIERKIEDLPTPRGCAEPPTKTTSPDDDGAEAISMS